MPVYDCRPNFTVAQSRLNRNGHKKIPFCSVCTCREIMERAERLVDHPKVAVVCLEVQGQLPASAPAIWGCFGACCSPTMMALQQDGHPQDLPIGFSFCPVRWATCWLGAGSFVLRSRTSSHKWAGSFRFGACPVPGIHSEGRQGHSTNPPLK